MEQITLSFDPARFDEVLHQLGCPPECGDLELCFKPNATMAGRTGVAITFTVEIDGKRMRVQAVTTLRNLRGAIDSVPYAV